MTFLRDAARARGLHQHHADAGLSLARAGRRSPCAIERLIDKAARELGFDRVELRRKNLIGAKRMPYSNAVGARTTAAPTKPTWIWRWRSRIGQGFTSAQARRRARGKLLGLGLCQLCGILDRLTAGARGHHRAAGGRRCRDRHAAGRPGPRDELRAGGRRPDGLPFETGEDRHRRHRRVTAGGGSHSGRSMRHAATVIAKARPI